MDLYHSSVAQGLGYSTVVDYKYKRRDIIEKEITKKRIVEIIKEPLPKPDTIIVPVPVPAEPQKKCCITCCCCDN